MTLKQMVCHFLDGLLKGASFRPFRLVLLILEAETLQLDERAVSDPRTSFPRWYSSEGCQPA